MVNGVSQTNPFGLSQKDYGALKDFAGGDEALLRKAIGLTDILTPKQEEIDPAMLAFLYFSRMGELASQPGATLFGSAAGAATSPAEYLMRRKEADKKADASRAGTAVNLISTLKKSQAGSGKQDTYAKRKAIGIELGLTGPELTEFVLYGTRAPAGSSDKAVSPLGKLAADLAAGFITQDEYDAAYAKATNISGGSTNLKPFTLKQATNIAGISYNAGETVFLTDAEQLENREFLSPSTDNSIKTVGTGTQALLMSEEDAKKFVRSQGIEESNENFSQYVSMLTAPNDDLIGKPLVRGDSFTKIVPLQIGNKVSALQFSPISGQTPGFVKFRDKRLEILAKNKDTHLDNIGNSVPRIETAMNTLLSGQVETGAITEFTFPVKRFLAQAFGTDAAVITALDDLQAISFYLAPKMRPVGSGSTSDMEFKAYQQAILDLGKTTEANYISLYAMKKMMEKGVELKFLEEELLTSGRINNTTELNAKLRSVDTGIFEKYEGDPDNQQEFDNWYNSLPNGAVIVNNGLEAFGNTPYYIKGFRRD